MPQEAIQNILTQHVEEASFLWTLRDAAVRRPDYLLDEIAELDERVEAHLDGLRIAGDPCWEVCAQAMADGDAGEAFAAAVVALERGHAAEIDEVVKVAAVKPDLGRGLVSALGWLPFERVKPFIRQFLEAEPPALRRVGLAAAAVHRREPPLALAPFLTDPDPGVKARALRAAGELGLLDYHRAASKQLAADDPHVRYWAAWSGTLLGGDAKAVATLQAVMEEEGPYQERALQMALRRLDLPTARHWCRRALRQPEPTRLAILGAGVLGDAELVSWLLEFMQLPPLARAAGEAFSMITGADFVADNLEGEAPKGFQAGPTDNPEDEDVAMDPDEDLPWPGPEAVRKWWDARRGDFTNGTRYLVGKPISAESCQQVLRTGYQRQRAAAALELALLRRGQPLFEVRAPGFRQKQALAPA